jgi:hypothetical protein
MWRIRSFFCSLMRCFQYVPTIWNNEDWDYWHILVLLRYKMQRTHDCLVNGYSKSESVLCDIKKSIEMLDRIIADDYCEKWWDAYYAKWNPNMKLRTKIDENGHCVMEGKSPQEEAEFKMIVDTEHRLQEQDWTEFWDFLGLHCREWWD